TYYCARTLYYYGSSYF
nr:immunoglobulin heavy chain junction region [Mus musculus]